MNLESSLPGINNWIKNYFASESKREAPDPNHYLTGWEDDWLLYGTDSAQRPYLAVLHLVCELKKFSRLGVFAIENGAQNLNKQAESRISNSRIVFQKNNIKVCPTGNPLSPYRLQGTNFPTPESKDFFERFNASPFSLAGTPATKLDIGVKKHDIYFKDKDWTDDIGILRFYAVRRACKFLLYDAISQDYKIRYALDDLDLAVVAMGSRPAVAGIYGGKVPVCTTELREIFRSWDFFKNHVTFYLDFKKVAPPWSYANPHCSDEAMYFWAAYANHLATKQLKKNGHATGFSYENSMLVACKKLWDDVKFVPAIAHYHASKPSRHRAASLLFL